MDLPVIEDLVVRGGIPERLDAGVWIGVNAEIPTRGDRLSEVLRILLGTHTARTIVTSDCRDSVVILQAVRKGDLEGVICDQIGRIIAIGNLIVAHPGVDNPFKRYRHLGHSIGKGSPPL